MTGKERMLAALRCAELDSPPFWEIEFHLFDKFSDTKLVLGREFEKLTEKEKELALGRNAETLVSVSDKFGFSALTTPGEYWEVSPGTPAYYWLPQPYQLRQTELLLATAGAEMLMIDRAGGFYGIPEASHFAEFCYRLFDEPDAVEEDARRLFEESKERLRELRDLGVECILTPCDIADNKGIFMNPEQFERFFLQFFLPWVAINAEEGAYSILHTDGDITRELESLADSRLNALQAIDPVAGMDIARVKRQVGERLCLCGNMDCGLLEAGKPDEIRTSVEKLLDDMSGLKGFAFGSSNALQMTVPEDNYMAMAKAFRGKAQAPM